MVSSSGMGFVYPPKIRSAHVKALEAATAFLVWQGTSQAPATGSHGEPMVF